MPPAVTAAAETRELLDAAVLRTSCKGIIGSLYVYKGCLLQKLLIHFYRVKMSSDYYMKSTLLLYEKYLNIIMHTND